MRQSAVIAGIGLLIMVLTVPFAEFQIFPSLIDYKSPEITAKNLHDNKSYFILGIFLNFITIICDIIVAWALYVFLKPVNKQLSLLVAWFRIVYTAIYLIALLNLIKVLGLLNADKYFLATSQEQVFDQILFYFNSFGREMGFGLILFGIYLGLLGYLALRSTYIPKIISWLLVLAGLGYFITYSGNYLFPSVNTDWLMVTFFGELVFMFWLLLKGGRKGPA
ncbi:DUF4386 domain-containing protein [Poritiphilus flavus]|uniref:DUF4386 family protein n=1 Tax=Poritiphilus flavus TaxID=2697053 RepID=A0A6L9EC75_9FLAO|nr:DUF4386 domain-containing protein [Poritiphilus flavus]NAS12201.1 DUF4386 family protein [Poritiphilus flavus]